MADKAEAKAIEFVKFIEIPRFQKRHSFLIRPKDLGVVGWMVIVPIFLPEPKLIELLLSYSCFKAAGHESRNLVSNALGAVVEFG